MDNLQFPPVISVVLPVYNGAALLDRALHSVLRQTFQQWEVVAVDDGSTDGSYEALQQWAAKDCRVRAVRLEENSGVGRARNAALENARGALVTYLDQDDEYFADFLANAAHFRDKAEVLVFGYDFVYDDGRPQGRALNWDPRRVRELLFVRGIATPLGVAHRRELWHKVGGFNELLWRDEDWDLCKRLARAGAEFAFLPLKSGRYHVRPDSLSRVPHLTRRQREAATANWEAGRPIYDTLNLKSEISDLKSQEHPHPNPLPQAGEGTSRTHHAPRDEFNHAERDEYVRKIAYVAPHCLIDPTSGAAVATAQGMRFLQTLGFQCRAFCGSRLDRPEDVESMLQRHEIAYRQDTMTIGNSQVAVLVAALGGFGAGGSAQSLEVTIVPNERAQQTEFYRACGAFLDADRPDAVVTYGGDPLAETLILLAKNRDLPLVFWLHNFAYRDPQACAHADYVLVPTQTARQHYWTELGLACHHLPCVIDWSRVSPRPPAPLPEGAEDLQCPRPGLLPDGQATLTARYVTFITPQAIKGLFVFARVAEVLSRRRPDISLMVVEGRTAANWQQETGIDLGQLPNLKILPGAADPRDFYRETKLLLVPSLMENACLVASEAMINGIPVLASNRGALPETIGDAGFLLDIPARYTPETHALPTAEEVERWVETIIRLWDDAAEYERWSRAARERAQQWHPDRIAPIYREFFTHLTHQPGPPLVPREVVK